MRSNTTLQWGIIFAALAVILGAFGAHALRSKISDYQIGIYQTGIQYQFYHALALVALSVLQDKFGVIKSRAALFFVIGIVLFSFSLYGLAVKDLHHTPAHILGPITPIGGVCFIIGWVLMLLETRPKNNN